MKYGKNIELGTNELIEMKEVAEFIIINKKNGSLSHYLTIKEPVNIALEELGDSDKLSKLDELTYEDKVSILKDLGYDVYVKI